MCASGGIQNYRWVQHLRAVLCVPVLTCEGDGSAAAMLGQYFWGLMESHSLSGSIIVEKFGCNAFSWPGGGNRCSEQARRESCGLEWKRVPWGFRAGHCCPLLWLHPGVLLNLVEATSGEKWEAFDGHPASGVCDKRKLLDACQL